MQQNMLYPNKFVSDIGLMGLVKNSNYVVTYIGEIFSKSYFHIFGELFQLEIADYDFSEFSYGACHSSTNNELHRRTQCPERSFMTMIILAFYMMVSNIVLLNMLIALFSNTYDEIKAKSKIIWAGMRYETIIGGKNPSSQLKAPFSFNGV